MKIFLMMEKGTYHGRESLEFWELKTFVDLVDAGSVQNLVLNNPDYQNYDKATIRKRIEAMGNALNVKDGNGLYDFGTHSPTDAGRVLLLDAKDIIKTVHKARQRVEIYNGQREDFLSFGMTTTIGGTFVPGAMQLLMKRRDVRHTYMDIISDFSTRLFDRFKDHGGVHFLLLPGYVVNTVVTHNHLEYLNRGEKRKKNASKAGKCEVAYHTLLTEKVQAFVGEGHPFAQKSCITLSELRHSKLILRALGSSLFHYVEEKVGEPIRIEGNFPLLVGNQQLIFDCVAANLGVGVTSERALERCPGLHALDIVRDDGTPIDIKRNIDVLYYPDELTIVEKEFLAAMQEAHPAYVRGNEDIRKVLQVETAGADAF